MKLFCYFRSSAAYRVRIALNMKGLAYERAVVHLRRGEQHADPYRRLNPSQLVPLLEDGGTAVSQSLAILEYLEETHPQPPLLPRGAADRAFVRSIALQIACDIHPLNNLRVLNHLRQDFALDPSAVDRWYHHWIRTGLAALEEYLGRDRRVGAYCCGDQPGLADVCLVPQIYNAERMHCDLSGYPTLTRIADAARMLPAFAAAEPGRQADAE